MTLFHRPPLAIALALFALFLLSLAGARWTAPGLAARLSSQASTAIADAGGEGVVEADFTSLGLASRHPLLRGGEALDATTRARIARAVGAIPGVGGVRWADSGALVDTAPAMPETLDCQNDVAALLRTRTIRFEESSARIDAASLALVDEVAAALRPCLGAIIAVTGHTDASGDEAANLALSAARAQAVQAALVARDIPADGLRASGLGAARPVEGLLPDDPANRRIEFAVIAAQPLAPTPVDTPGAR